MGTFIEGFLDFNNRNRWNHLKSGLKRSKLELYQSSSLLQRLFEKQTSFDKQLDSLTDLLSEMETRGPFNPKVAVLKVEKRNEANKNGWREPFAALQGGKK